MEKSEAIATLRAHLDGGGWLHPVTLSEETVKGILDLLRETPDVVRCGECRWRLRCLISGGINGNCDENWYCAAGERGEIGTEGES